MAKEKYLILLHDCTGNVSVLSPPFSFVWRKFIIRCVD